MNEDELKNRTKAFALMVIDFCETLPKKYAAEAIAKQLIRSSTSVAANYRAACRGRTSPDFANKLGVVEEEADESLFWLEMLRDANLASGEKLNTLLKEADELTAIFTASHKTAKSNLRYRKSQI
ncbi:MAG: four helix bundle protein [Anaerolineales bacterium]